MTYRWLGLMRKWVCRQSSTNARRAPVISGDDATGTQGHGRGPLRECGCAIRSGLLSECVPHYTLKLIRESPEPDCWFRSAGRTPAIKSNFYMAFLFFSAKNRSVNLGNSANDREMIHWR